MFKRLSGDALQVLAVCLLSALFSIAIPTKHKVTESTTYNVENSISSCANINLQVTRHGHWLLPCVIICTMQDLAMEACYTIHKNDY